MTSSCGEYRFEVCDGILYYTIPAPVAEPVELPRVAFSGWSDAEPEPDE